MINSAICLLNISLAHFCTKKNVHIIYIAINPTETKYTHMIEQIYLHNTKVPSHQYDNQAERTDRKASSHQHSSTCKFTDLWSCRFAHTRPGVTSVELNRAIFHNQDDSFLAVLERIVRGVPTHRSQYFVPASAKTAFALYLQASFSTDKFFTEHPQTKRRTANLLLRGKQCTYDEPKRRKRFLNTFHLETAK